MSKIIFVCTGNTCRSPMAEMIMKDLLKTAEIDYIQVYSRGLSVFNSSPVSIHAQTLLSMKNIDSSSHCSTLLSEDDFTTDTLILTMTAGHKQHICAFFPQVVSQTYTLAEYVSGPHVDIQDPYGGSFDIYQECYTQLEKLLKKLIKNLPTL